MTGLFWHVDSISLPLLSCPCHTSSSCVKKSLVPCTHSTGLCLSLTHTTLSLPCSFIELHCSSWLPLAFHIQFGISLSDLQSVRILTEIIYIHWECSFISNTQSPSSWTSYVSIAVSLLYFPTSELRVFQRVDLPIC